MHPIQEGQAAPVLEEVADGFPFRSRQFGQRRGDLGLGPDAVVEPAVGTEPLERGAGAAPGRFHVFDSLERRRLPPSGAGGCGRVARIETLVPSETSGHFPELFGWFLDVARSRPRLATLGADLFSMLRA
jgi:hypothetical protein